MPESNPNNVWQTLRTGLWTELPLHVSRLGEDWGALLKFWECDWYWDHKRLLGNWGLNPTGLISDPTKISTFSINFKRDSYNVIFKRESYKVIFRMSVTQCILNWHTKDQENLTCRERHSTGSGTEMTQTLELSDKAFKTGIINIIQ